jgi:hypothetical protein
LSAPCFATASPRSRAARGEAAIRAQHGPDGVLIAANQREENRFHAVNVDKQLRASSAIRWNSARGVAFFKRSTRS